MNLAKTLTAALAVVLAGTLSSVALAGGGKGGCDRCGCGDACSVATLVKTMKTIEVDCYTCVDSAVVLPGKSCRGDKNCEIACDNTNCGCGLGSRLGLDIGRACGCGKGGCSDGCDGKGGHGAHQRGCDGCGSKDGKGGKGCSCDMSRKDNLFTSTKKYFTWFDWSPNCAETRSVKRLIRHTVTKDVPSYEWVVEDLCKGCDSKGEKAGEGANIEPGADVPPPPPVEARLRYRNIHNVPVSFDQEKKASLIRLPEEFMSVIN